MKKIIDFSEVAMENMQDIIDREGHKTFSAAVHAVVANYWNRTYFDKRKTGFIGVTKKKEEKLTIEQVCEMKGGTVMVNEGIPSCKLKYSATGNLTTFIPLTLENDIRNWKIKA